MGFTKADRKAFLEMCETAQELMPRTAIIRQASMFEDVIEVENLGRRWQHLTFNLMYLPTDDNPNRNPIPKQSARFGVKRHLSADENGNKKGDVFVYINKRGNRDVITTLFPETKVIRTTEMLKEQLLMQIKAKYPEFTKFRGAIFIKRLEMVFKYLDTFPKYVMDDLKNGSKIYFKETKPDCDNLEKLIYDAMEDILYDNDARIVAKNAVFKRYGMRPGVIIELEGEI